MVCALQLIFLFVVLVAVANVVRVNSHLLGVVSSSPSADNDATGPALGPRPRRRIVRICSVKTSTKFSFYLSHLGCFPYSIPPRQKSRRLCFSFLTPSLPPSSLSSFTPSPHTASCPPKRKRCPRLRHPLGQQSLTSCLPHPLLQSRACRQRSQQSRK